MYKDLCPGGQYEALRMWATNQVDLKRSRGNLQLHCKSGTFSIFLFILFLVRNLSGCFLDEVSIVHVGLGSQRQHRLVRIVSPRNSEKSIMSQVFQDNISPQMDHP